MVPNSPVRKGSFVGKNAVLMPCYVNIGAYIDEGTMFDTFARAGSCSQIGKNCHISAASGVGGVLEPAQALPTIIEDNVFLGAMSEVVEGVIVGEGSVISMGMYIGQSTKIVIETQGRLRMEKYPHIQLWYLDLCLTKIILQHLLYIVQLLLNRLMKKQGLKHLLMTY